MNFNYNKILNSYVRIITILLLMVVTTRIHGKIIVNVSDSLSEVLDYYPLQNGNKWIFHETTVDWQDFANHSSRIWQQEITGDTVMKNNLSYKILSFRNFGDEVYNYLYERIDSSSAKIYSFDENADSTNFESIELDLLMNLGDTITFKYGFIIFTEEDSINLWNNSYPKRTYGFEVGYNGYSKELIKNIGLYKYFLSNDFYGYTEATLLGCNINGKIYGDTSYVTGINNRYENIPTKIKLYQNYPNPFNPTTTIKYTIMEYSNVLLKVYDLLGRKVKTLVDEEKFPGSYNVVFDADGFANGIYFVTLKTDYGQQTKKALLVK